MRLRHTPRALAGREQIFDCLAERSRAEVKRLYDAGGVTQQALADKLGMGTVNIQHVVRGGRTISPIRCLLRPDQAEEIRQHADNGESRKSIAELFDVSAGTIGRVLSGAEMVGTE
jgi:plasmid stabilization system protein ParE